MVNFGASQLNSSVGRTDGSAMVNADDPDADPKDGPDVVGRSPGGSRLLKYGGGEFRQTPFGFPDEDTGELAETRERVYAELFGPSATVYHEMMPLIPHVDVYVIEPRAERQFYTLVTGGMSDLAMNSPAELGADARRVELVFYAAEAKDDYTELLRTLAHFPHDNKTWLHHGHTMPNGSPPAPIFGSGPLDTFYFMRSIVGQDATLPERLRWRDDPIELLWLVPITAAECQLKLEKGSDALLDVFDRVNHPFVFAGDRSSYV
jgi:hypothetical protein